MKSKIASLTRSACLLGAVIGVMLAWPGLAAAQAPSEPAGCSGSIKTVGLAGDEAGQTNANPYEATDDVWLRGDNFPLHLTPATVSYQIEDVNDKLVVKARTTFAANGTVTPEMFSGGSFVEKIWAAVERIGLVPNHEYKVTVFFLNASGQECQKSDNFFALGGPVAAQFVAAVAAAGPAMVGGVPVIPTVACPTGITVSPRTLTLGQRTRVRVSVRINGNPVSNALVILRGAGIQKSAKTGAGGIARFTVTARRTGVLRVFVPNVFVRRAGVLGAVAGGGGLTG